MDFPDLRRANFRLFLNEECSGNAAEAARRIKRSPSQVNDLLSARKSFGEKFARNIEPLMAKPLGWLDQDHEAGGDDADLHDLSRHYQTADATKKAALHDLAELPNEAAADLTPLLEALKLKYKPPS